MKNMHRTAELRRAYALVLERYGHQQWWPGETPFEVCVGAILTQNTSWTNVERAIANLKSAGVMNPKGMYELSPEKLAALIRPAGYFNVKARRLRCFLRVLVEEFAGDLNLLFAGDTSSVRERLLAINGIGPETADCLLLYAGQHHSFVVDAYTRRIMERHGWLELKAGIKSAPAKGNDRKIYEAIKAIFEESLDEKGPDGRLDYWQDYHAQLVMVGKEFCRKRKPECEACPLKPLLRGNTGS